MVLLGLTGGIATGKSVVAARLAGLGAVHIDADRLAREVVEPGTPGLARIAEEFGAGVLRPDGSLDRAALGAIVFSDHDKRERLNAITHPAVWARTRELIDEAERADPAAVIVYDVPLLVEASASRPLRFDHTAVTVAGRDTQLERLVEVRGMSRADAESRLAAQASDADRMAVADTVLDTSGTLEHTLAQTDALFAVLSGMAASR